MLRWGRLLVTASLSALLLAAGAIAADAATKKKKKPKAPTVITKTATGTTASRGQAISVTARCPAGRIALGGGYEAPPTISLSSLTDINVIHESRRASASSWVVSAVRIDGEAAGPTLTLTASVYCRSPKLKPKRLKNGKRKKRTLSLTQVSTTSPAAGLSQSRSATAVCPPGAKAISGGFASSPIPTQTPQSLPSFWENARSGSGWTVSFFNVGSTARTATSSVYCATKASAVETLGTQTIAGSSGGVIGQAAPTSAPCPAGRSLIGGGFVNPAPSPSTPTAFIIGSAALATGWRTSTVNLTPTPGTVAARGYCL